MVQQTDVGAYREVTVRVAAWHGAVAAVDLSCACIMLTREACGASVQAGFAHLDAALGGALTALRRDGHFTAAAMATLLISR